MNDTNPREFIGANLPPLDELLPAETAEMASRAGLLIERADKAIVKDDTTASDATTLAGMMQEHVALIDKARDERMRPHLTATRTINAHFNAIIGTMATFDTKGKIIAGPLFRVRTQIDEFRRKKEAEALAERRRLEEEARQQRLAAEAAERARRDAEDRERRAAEDAARRVREAEEAARLATNRAEREKAQREAAEAEALRKQQENAARVRQMEAELAQRRAEEESERLERQAAATVATAIASPYGPKASRRTVWIVEIDDLTKAIAHARRIDEDTLRACIQSIYEKQVRAGVRTLLGATVREDSSTSIRTK